MISKVLLSVLWGSLFFINAGLYIYYGNIFNLVVMCVYAAIPGSIAGYYFYGRMYAEWPSAYPRLITKVSWCLWPLSILYLLVRRHSILGPRAYTRSAYLALHPSMALNGLSSMAKAMATVFGTSMQHGMSAFISNMTPPTIPRQRSTFEVSSQSEPVYGWRKYDLTDDWRLKGTHSPWGSAEFNAVCIYGNGISPRDVCADHIMHDSCPSSAGGCGIWAASTPRDSYILGRCVAWGVVLIDSEGNWRASNVRIEELVLVKEASPFRGYLGLSRYVTIDHTRLATDLHIHYDVPVRIVDTLEELRYD